MRIEKKRLGASETLRHYLLKKTSDHGLFKPYQPAFDMYHRATTIVTAPVFYACHSIKLTLESVCLLVLSVLDIMYDPAESTALLIEALSKAVESISFALIAIVSPFINALDLVGGGIATVMEDKGDEGKMHNSSRTA